MSRSALRRLLTAAGTALAVAGAAAAPAGAYTASGNECQLVDSPLYSPLGDALTDALGVRFSIGVGGESDSYATLSDGGTTFVRGDAWNNFGQLFVGSAPGNAAAYSDGNPLGCSRTLGGRQIDFATVTRGSLQIRRSILVSGTTPGARLIDAVTNTSGAPVTTNVWVGDLLSGHANGLGSDDGTTVRSSSSGDATVSTADLWAVTTDRLEGLIPHSLDPGIVGTSDPAVAHVWGGPGAAQSVSVVRSGSQPGDRPLDDPAGTLDGKQFGWGWQSVSLDPGETARFVSFELARETVSRDWRDQAPLARSSALDLMAAPLATRYQGLSPAEVGTVRNWASPAVAAQISPITGATTESDVTLSATAVDFGSGQLASCTDGTLDWDFGDGHHATGATVSHRFAAGTANVTLTVSGECGGTTTRTSSFQVVTPTPTATPVPTLLPTPTPDPTPAPTAVPTPTAVADARAASAPADDAGDEGDDGPSLRLYGPPSVKTTTLASAHGLVVGVAPSVDGDVRIVLTGTGVKSVKTAKALKAGQTSFVRVQLDPSARKPALSLKTIRLRAKLTSSVDGREVIESLILKLRR